MVHAMRGPSPKIGAIGRDRALFQTERPVLTFMEDFVSGDDATDIRHELTVQILTQIRDSLDLIRRKQDTFDGALREFGGEIHTVSERVVRLEERNERFTRIENENARMAGQIELLVADKNKRDGAIGAWSWLANNWPVAGLATALGALVAYANGLIGGKP